MWRIDLSAIHEQQQMGKSWRDIARVTPSKSEMYAAGAEALLDGWTPATPLIGPETRVVAFGSCFASRFAEWLADHGYNRAFRSDGDETLVRNQVEAPSVIAQQFRWAFGELDPDLAFWVGRDRRRFEATEEHRVRLRDTLAGAEVLILTLGLAEHWYDKESGEPIWRVPPRDNQERDRYAVRMATVAESVDAFETIDRLRRAHMPDQKVLLTVSPQRLGATFRSMSPIVANVATKAVLRVAVDEFLSAHAAELNETYFYFPAYEVVTELLVDPLEDNMHLRDECAALVLELFARSYAGHPSGEQLVFPSSPEDGLLQTIAELDTKCASLQAECDARLDVIAQLKTATDERQAVIERLQAAQPATDATASADDCSEPRTAIAITAPRSGTEDAAGVQAEHQRHLADVVRQERFRLESLRATMRGRTAEHVDSIMLRMFDVEHALETNARRYQWHTTPENQRRLADVLRQQRFCLEGLRATMPGRSGDLVDSIMLRMFDVEHALEINARRRRWRAALATLPQVLASLRGRRAPLGLPGNLGSPLRAIARRWRRLRSPRLGVLQQHEPRALRLPARYWRTKPPTHAPSLSIVTPSFEQGTFLERTLLSVIEQHYPRLEYVVQDGGSSDETAGILLHHQEALMYWESERDEGQADALNRGFARTTGEIMAYLNADDLLLPGSLAYVARYFAAHPEIDVIYGHRLLINTVDQEVGKWLVPRHGDSALPWVDYIPQETLFWRRRVWEAAGSSFDPALSYALDWDLLLRFRSSGATFARVPRFLGAFRVHAGQKTQREVAVGDRECAELRERVHGRPVSAKEANARMARYMRSHVRLQMRHTLLDQAQIRRRELSTIPRELGRTAGANA